MPARWEVVPGRELQEAHEGNESLDALVPEAPGIYLWRRSLRVPPAALASTDLFTKWLHEAMQTPIADVRDQPLSHFAIVDRFTIRSSGFTPKKQEQFQSLMATRKARVWLARYVRDLGNSAPPLYCGEAGNLTQRTRQHLSGETGFGQRIQEEQFGVSWSDLDLAFCCLDDSEMGEAQATNLRKLLELVTTAFSIAGHVSRRG